MNVKKYVLNFEHFHFSQCRPTPENCTPFQISKYIADPAATVAYPGRFASHSKKVAAEIKLNVYR